MNEEQHSKGKKKIELLKSEAAFSISVFDFPDFFTFFFLGRRKGKFFELPWAAKTQSFHKYCSVVNRIAL